MNDKKVRRHQTEVRKRLARLVLMGTLGPGWGRDDGAGNGVPVGVGFNTRPLIRPAATFSPGGEKESISGRELQRCHAYGVGMVGVRLCEVAGAGLASAGKMPAARWRSPGLLFASLGDAGGAGNWGKLAPMRTILKTAQFRRLEAELKGGDTKLRNEAKLLLCKSMYASGIWFLRPKSSAKLRGFSGIKWGLSSVFGCEDVSFEVLRVGLGGA